MKWLEATMSMVLDDRNVLNGDNLEFVVDWQKKTLRSPSRKLLMPEDAAVNYSFLPAEAISEGVGVGPNPELLI